MMIVNFWQFIFLFARAERLIGCNYFRWGYSEGGMSEIILR